MNRWQPGTIDQSAPATTETEETTMSTTPRDIRVLNQQALLLAVEALRNNDQRLITQLGLDGANESLARQLRELNASNFTVVQDFRGTLVQVKFDTRQLQLFVELASSKTNEDDQVNQAIRAGLRQPMLEELKGTTRREYTSRRTLMGLPEHSKGRIENLSEEDEIRVLRTWKSLESVSDPLERWLKLHELTGIQLDRAWLVVRGLAR
jgi:hypothetical protein